MRQNHTTKNEPRPVQRLAQAAGLPRTGTRLKVSIARLVISNSLIKAITNPKTWDTQFTPSAARLPLAVMMPQVALASRQCNASAIATFGPIALRPGIATGLPFRGCEAAGHGKRPPAIRLVGREPVPIVERRETHQPGQEPAAACATTNSHPSET